MRLGVNLARQGKATDCGDAQVASLFGLLEVKNNSARWDNRFFPQKTFSVTAYVGR